MLSAYDKSHIADISLSLLGDDVGNAEGLDDGNLDGFAVGQAVGFVEGDMEGFSVGKEDGEYDGE